jgi:hypothetical protein
MPIKCICLECSKEFFLKPFAIKRGRGKFCSITCKGLWMQKNYNGNNNPNYNNKWSNEKKYQFSNSRMGERNPYYKGKLSNEYLLELGLKQLYYQQQKIERQEQLHQFRLNIIPSDISKQISSEVNKGKFISSETRNKISNSMMGRIVPIEVRMKISKSSSGDKNRMWKGGISFEPYCRKFNKDFRNRVRLFWNYTCGECGKTQEDNGKKLSVHHIHYDKKVCCNDKPAMFISLCEQCHMKTNHKRELYEHKYETLINEKYNGKSYYTREEYIEILKSQFP